MKITKPMFIAALIAGNLFAWNLALRADDATNTPPAVPPGAPPPGDHGQRGHLTVDQLAKRLDLTDDQKVKVKPIIDAQNQQMSDLRQDTDLSREDRMAKMKAIHDDTTAQLKPILTEDQFAKWLKISRMPHRPMQNGDNPPPANPPPDAPPQN
jgi:Spy/CpxP family protein refolding chaperone